MGVEVAPAGTPGPLVRVLGMKRDISLASQDVTQIADSKVGEGRLAFATKNGVRVILTKAQPSQLHFLLARLRGKPGSAPEAGPRLGGSLGGHKAEPTSAQAKVSLQQTLQQTAAPCRAVRACHSQPASEVPKIGLADMSREVLKQVPAFCEDR